jgi:hypothetical protein
LDRDEFYDLESDPYETKNIMNTVNREKVAWSRDILLKWMKDNRDPLLFWATPML